MKNKIKAFPLEMNDDSTECNLGMDLRDYFAAKAMHATLWDCNRHALHTQDDVDFEMMASVCYEIADAMIEARETK